VQKILALTSSKSDVVFLSDLRLNSTRQISAVHDLEKKLFFRGYKLFHNSTLPSRGVGILISKKLLDTKFSIVSTVASNDCNWLILNTEINSKKLALISVYGPNHDNEITVYDDLSDRIRGLESPLIMGGDWNATLDISDVHNNLDVVNMRNIPSLRRSEKILEMCRNYNLIDPFRTCNPDKREYTYIPSSIIEQNRSRLDFFLMSHELLNGNTHCSIPHSLNTTLFDHKMVDLSLSGKRKPSRNIIKDSILDDVDSPFFVKNSVFECYLNHWIPGPNVDGTITSENDINNMLFSISQVFRILRNIREIEKRMALEGTNDLDEMLIAAERAEVRLIFEDLPELDFFEGLSTGMAPDFFLQTLANGIKNNVLSHQSEIFKLRNLKTTVIKKNITELKRNFNQNVAEILAKERELSSLLEGALKAELAHFKKFETLNDEKITPYFMSIVKTKNATDSLKNLKQHDGTEFISNDELKGHVYEYYRNIYKQPDNESKHTTIEDVNEFLGPVANNPIVINAKLSDNEKEELEAEISLQELTESINSANMSSAPGSDGISSKFIKQFWNYFKNPLLKLCRNSFESGSIPLFLKTANIRLIPKKGDTSKIKNWRPISLLNCFYKIISRVITTRLRKYMDKMTPICQKGYSSTRYCQEVLISVMEGIEKCNSLKERQV